MNETIKKYNRKHIGEIHVSNEGYSIEVVDGGSKKGYCTVLVDGQYKTEAKYSNVKKGGVKNPMHLSMCGVGCRGIGSHKVSVDGKATKKYACWKRMIYRSHDAKYHDKRPTYKGVTVCKKWHNFQTFAAWFDDNYIDGFVLDKDLLSDDKVYSSETCVFIPPALNSFLANNYSTNISGFVGVSWDKVAKRWKAVITEKSTGKNKNLGYFHTKKEASKAYQAQRAIYAKEWQEEMHGILPEAAIRRIA